MTVWRVVSRLCVILVVTVTFFSPSLAQEPLRIVATTTQASDLVRVLIQDVPNVELTPLMGAGVDPHLYQPTEANIVAMSRADVIVYSGLHLEARFQPIFSSLREQGVRIIALSEAIEREGYTLEAMDEVGVPDPHFWFDPRNWQLATTELARHLVKLAPEHSDKIIENAIGYDNKLNMLFAWGSEAMAQVPEAQRYLVTSHDAFQYFGDAFGWQMVAIQGISTASEAGVGDIQGVVAFVVEQGIPVLFVESSVPVNTIRAVQEAVKAQGRDVQLGLRELYSDAMGNEGEFGATYLGMMTSNIVTILASYQAQGVELTLPQYPEGLPLPDEDDDLLNWLNALTKAE
jgi:manganese/zinc/iron transport system substrate-binding protein